MATNSQVVKTITIQLNTKDSKIKIDGITKGFVEAGQAAQDFSAKASQGFDALATGANNARNATGSASATVLEAGRVVSDFNYGIRGVANNLSQLANNFVFTAEKAGGFTAGLKDIGKAFMGPLGIILAINVVIAAFERFSMETEKAKKATDELENSLKGEIKMLKIYKDALSRANVTLEQRGAIVKGLALLDKDFNDKLKEAADNTERLKEITEEFLRVKELEFEIDLKRNELKESFNKKSLLQAEQDEQLNKVREANFIQFALMNMNFMGMRKTIFDDIAETTGDLMVVEKEYNKVLDEYLKLLKDANIEEEKSGGNTKYFKQKYLDLTKIISGFEKREELGVERVEANKLKIRQRFEVEDLELRKKAFMQKELLRYQDFMDSNASDKQKALAKEKYEKSIEKARVDHLTALRQLNLTHSVETLKLEEEQDEKLIQLDFDLQDKRLDLTSKYTDISMIMASTAANNTLKAEISHEEKRLKLFKGSEFERTEAEKNLAMMRIELQDEELEHELMIIDMKMKAQLEYANFVSGIGNVFKTIGKENEGLAKVALVLEKGAAIAGVVVEAQAANQKILSASQTEVGFYNASAAATALLSPERSATFKLAAGAAQAGAAKRIAKNNIGAGIAIANILATTLTSRTAPSGGGSAGGGAGGGGGRTFDFNLVGSTGTNQLAEAVGGQFQEPIQAYVVSNEITSQQELDLQIQTGASLGD